jgi:hypothetical protein
LGEVQIHRKTSKIENKMKQVKIGSHQQTIPAYRSTKENKKEISTTQRRGKRGKGKHMFGSPQLEPTDSEEDDCPNP